MAEKQPQHGGKRPGSGRPRKYNGKTVMVGAAVPADLAERLDAYAEAQKISKSEAVVRALQKLLGKRRPAR